jgi:hypothetical protein
MELAHKFLRDGISTGASGLGDGDDWSVGFLFRNVLAPERRGLDKGTAELDLMIGFHRG